MRPNDRQRWWQVRPEEIHQAVFAMANEMEHEQAARRSENEVLRRLYGAKGSGCSVHGDAFYNLSTAPRVATLGRGQLTYNVIRTAVDVLGAKVGRGKPKPSFVTTGGDWAAQRRAKRLDRYVYGVLNASDAYRKFKRSFRDGCVADLGVIMGWVEDERICLQRVDPDEIKVAVGDSHYGDPRTLVRSYVIARDKAHSLVDAWHERDSEKRKSLHHQVDMAARGTDSDKAGVLWRAFGDVVQVHEAWHLPSGRVEKGKKHNGRHVLALSTVALVDEPATFFPFAFCRVFEPTSGWYAQGVAELLVPHQQSVNTNLRRITEIVANMATSKTWLDNGSKMVREQVASNESALVIRGGNKPPVTLAVNPVPADLWQLVEWPIRRGLEQVGINETAAAAQKPAGLNSGQAQRDYQDIQSERHALIHQAYEDFILDAGRLVVRLSAQAAEENVKLRAFYPRGRRSEPIDWGEVALDEDEFLLQVHSTSNLPTTPAARKQYVEELWASGQIDSAEYRRLLDMPDTEAATDLALAARDVVDWALEKMLDGDDDEGAEEDYNPPEPFDDLGYALKRAAVVYARARMEGAPEGRLELVRRYMLQAQAMLAQAQAAGTGAMRAPDAAMPTPSAAPTAMPQ